MTGNFLKDFADSFYDRQLSCVSVLRFTRRLWAKRATEPNRALRVDCTLLLKQGTLPTMDTVPAFKSCVDSSANYSPEELRRFQRKRWQADCSMLVRKRPFSLRNFPAKRLLLKRTESCVSSPECVRGSPEYRPSASAHRGPALSSADG